MNTKYPIRNAKIESLPQHPESVYISSISDMVVDICDNTLYLVHGIEHCIKKVDLKNGKITKLWGNIWNDTESNLLEPRCMALDHVNRCIYITDSSSIFIKKLDLDTHELKDVIIYDSRDHKNILQLRYPYGIVLDVTTQILYVTLCNDRNPWDCKKIVVLSLKEEIIISDHIISQSEFFGPEKLTLDNENNTLYFTDKYGSQIKNINILDGNLSSGDFKNYDNPGRSTTFDIKFDPRRKTLFMIRDGDCWIDNDIFLSKFIFICTIGHNEIIRPDIGLTSPWCVALDPSDDNRLYVYDNDDKKIKIVTFERYNFNKLLECNENLLCDLSLISLYT